jgi:hypothetical protein
MMTAKKTLEEEVKWKLRIYQEISNQKFNPDEPEKLPSPEVWRNYERANKRLKALNSAIKKEAKKLQLYLEGQAKAIDSIRRFREKN